MMDHIRDAILTAARHKGLNLAEISRSLGLNHAYMQQFIKRGTPRRLPEDIRIELARMLDLDETALKPNETRQRRAGQKNRSQPEFTAGDEAGELVIKIPRDSRLGEVGLKLLQLASKASKADLDAVLLRLEHPELYKPAPHGQFAQIAGGIRIGLIRIGIDPDSPQGARIIADALADHAAGVEPAQQVSEALARAKIDHPGSDTPAGTKRRKA